METTLQSLLRSMTEQLATIFGRGGLALFALLTVSIWNTPSFAQERCDSIFNEAPAAQANPLLHYSDQHFDLFVVGSLAKSESSWWDSAIGALSGGSLEQVRQVYQQIPSGAEDRAVRLLMIAEDQGLQMPPEYASKVSEARMQRSRLRAEDMEVAGTLTPAQMKTLTNLFTMVGIRRSKAERLFQRLKKKLGFQSAELVPVIQAHNAENVLGDEARLALLAYNQNVLDDKMSTANAYQVLTQNIYQIYQQKIHQTLTEPWFSVGGKSMSLYDFINAGAFRQLEIKPDNKWMNVVTLDSSKVQNPLLKGHNREMWWNRLNSINPVGTVRIARNTLVDENGKEKLVSVEVLRRGDDGIFVPYLFEADIRGRLQPVSGKGDIAKMTSCFQCHLRLSGIFFGGITMPNYKAVDDWHINNIDFTKRSSYNKFSNFRK